MKKPTSGDVFRVYVMPPGSSFPWVQVFHHPYGIKESGVGVAGVDAVHDRDALAKMLGEAIIDSSAILTAWTARPDGAEPDSAPVPEESPKPAPGTAGHEQRLSDEYLARVAALETTFPAGHAFLTRLHSRAPGNDLWLSTAVNAHLYKGDGFLAYIKLPGRSIVLSPNFNVRIVVGTQDEAQRLFGGLLNGIIDEHHGVSAGWALRRRDGSVEFTSRTPAAFLDVLAGALMTRA